MRQLCRGLLGLVLLSVGIGPQNGWAQNDSSPSTAPQRVRVDVAGADWSKRAKTASGLRIEETVRLRAEASEGRVTMTLSLPFPVNGVGPHWRASVPEGGAVDVALRTSPDGAAWTDWVSPSHETTIVGPQDGDRPRPAYEGDTSGGLLLTEADTRYVQVRLTLRRGISAGPVLRRFSLYAVDATEGPAPPTDARGPSTAKTAVDTAKPRVYTRDEWGAQSPTAAYRYARATHLAIHHTAAASHGAADTWDECAAAVRAIQDFHMETNGWIDIGYNYLICQTGDVFRGREDENDDRDVVGAHDGFNEGSVGTAGLGFFHPPENQRPTDELVGRFADLFAWIASERDIDPDGRDTYAGYGATVRTVYGHREVKSTACPGDELYAERSAIVDSAAAVVSEGEEEPEITRFSEVRPTPVRTEARFEVRLATGAVVTLRVYDLLGRRIATRRYGPLSAGTHTLSVPTARWAAGTYAYRIAAGDRTQTGTIQVVR